MSAYEQLTSRDVGDAGRAGPGLTSEPTELAPTLDGMARLLEVAAHNADQLLAEARDEAERVISAGRTEAERVLSEARGEVELMLAVLDETRSRANEEIAKLQQTEQDYRERMQAHLHEILAKVEASSIE